MQLKPGYAFKLDVCDSSQWKTSQGGAWDTVCIGPQECNSPKIIYLGERYIDSEKVAVFSTCYGTFAQSFHYCR